MRKKTAMNCNEDNDKEHVMNSKIDNIEIIINEKADEVLKNFLNHFLKDIN